jgi:hypothetical protein
MRVKTVRIYVRFSFREEGEKRAKVEMARAPIAREM